MADQRLEISFEDCLPADAARFAQALEQQLREFGPSASITLKKERADSQDFGATLVLVFGTPAAIALAKGVSAFLQRHSGASIRILKSGEVIAQNLDSKDVARVAEAFAGKRSS
jgi:hypothetical protein